MTDFRMAFSAFMPLCTHEPIWEWDIASDSFYLSKGALESLGLESAPLTIQDFYKFLPDTAVAEHAGVRDGVISGKAGSTAKCGYICNGHWVDEQMIALIRDSEGRATRLMGHMTISDVGQRMVFKNGQALLAEAGQWLYDVPRRLIWHDEVCDRILGMDNRPAYPISLQTSIFPVHPMEKSALRRHYELFCQGEFLGDTITDIVRVKIKGEYKTMMVRATAMQRDARGRAELIAGIMAQGEPNTDELQSLASEKLNNALTSIGSGQWNWDTKQGSIYFCPRYLAMLGYEPEDDGIMVSRWRTRIHPDDIAKVMQVQEQIIASPDHGDTYECTYRVRQAKGDWAWVFERGYVTWREVDGRAGHMIGSITNITTAQAERDKLEELVRHDALTGLRSRAFCNLEMEHIRQNDIRPVSAISVDITCLKMINDYLGHAMGDELLKKAAAIMRGALRRSDFIGRMGGDEFIVLLPGCDYEKGKKVLGNLASAFDSYNADLPSLPVFAALGLASADTQEQTLEDMLRKADERMYEDKKKHRREAHACLKALIKKATGKTVGADDRLTDE